MALSETGSAGKGLYAAQMSTVTARALPWHTWKHMPAAGDVLLVVALGDGLTFRGPPGWDQAGAENAWWHLHHPGELPPEVTAHGSGEWELRGYIAWGLEPSGDMGRSASEQAGGGGR